jgi:NAD(P)-dependent dehydrogenase (short-subunit alcohol dehydrogenase family)
MMPKLNLFNLQGKTAVVIGGSGTLGTAIAKGFGEAGAAVAICYRSTHVDDLLAEFKDQGIKANGYFIDVTDPDQIISCRDAVYNDFSKIDILVNLAGGNILAAITTNEKSFFDLPIDALKDVTWLNLFGGAIIPAQAFGQKMLENEDGGSIINITSMNTYRPLLGRPGYAAAKSAVSNFTQWLAVHIARDCKKEIRVNAIAPGFFLNVRMRRELFDDSGNYTDRGQAILSHTPMARLGEPEDLVGTAIWLASDASKFVTGAVIPVDGGFNAFAGV